MAGMSFQPYGVIPGEYKPKGLDLDIVMNDWKPDRPRPERIATFNQWRQDRMDEFTEAVWPRFDFADRQWKGGASTFAEQLTEFEIGAMINAFMGTPHKLDTHPSSPLAIGKIQSHRKHYEYEDQKPHPPGVNYWEYDHTLTVEEEQIFLDVMLSAISYRDQIGNKSAGHFWFKNQLQRPRPLHAAMVFRLEDNFLSELSERGQHPSIVSGHCLQGILMACAVLEDWMKSNNPNLSENRIESLGKYMVDFGDRRVFAGVHYPTDNIASWTLALSLIPEVFENHEPIVNFLRNAVLNHSRVFQLIRDQYTNEGVLGFTGKAIELLTNYGLPPHQAK